MKRAELTKQQAGADKLRFQAENEGDEQKQKSRWAEYEKAQKTVDDGHLAMQDDEVRSRELKRNITLIANTARIETSKLLAEKANAELLTALK